MLRCQELFLYAVSVDNYILLFENRTQLSSYYVSVYPAPVFVSFHINVLTLLILVYNYNTDAMLLLKNVAIGFQAMLQQPPARNFNDCLINHLQCKQRGPQI